MVLSEFFDNNPKVAIAFSGGVDSAYLLYAAKLYKADAMAYYVKSQFQPQFEYDEAVRMAVDLNIPLKVIELDVLACSDVRENSSQRCYYCKNRIFNEIIKSANDDGYRVILDGTNFSDDATDRPGMRALRELGVKSPLRECELTKDEIRSLSKEAGLFTWNKPAYACLATRIKTGEVITAESLAKVERAEGILYDMGFSDLRVRVSGDNALLQLKKSQFDLYYQKENEINIILSSIFKSISFDENGR